jgi:hypothetical protein
MALFQGSIPDLVMAVNRQSDTPLDYNGLLFSPIKGDYDLDDNRKTKVRITGKDDYQYRSSEVISYHRLDLGVLPSLLHRAPRITPKETLYDLLPELLTALGIRLSHDDVFDAEVIDQGSGDYRVILEAKPDSHGWIGSCVLIFNDLPPISIPITETELRW